MFHRTYHMRALFVVAVVGTAAIAFQNCSGGGFKVTESGVDLGSLADGRTGTSISGAPCKIASTPRRVWMLSRAEYDNSVAAILGDTSNQAQENFPVENRANGFSSNAKAQSVTGSSINMVISAAETIAANQAATQASQLGCTPSGSPSANNMDSCIIGYINKMGAKFYRRPLKSSEVSDLYSAYMTGFQYPYDNVPASTSGIQMILTSFLMAPQFLYRSELGDPNDRAATVKMTQYEIATALAYSATGAPPDSTLLAAAAANQLDTAGIMAQYNRLMGTSSGRARIAQFLMEWLGADTITTLGNSSSPLTPAIASYMKTETQYFINDVVFNGSGTLQDLFTANYTYVNGPLASYYGMSTANSADPNFSKVSAPNSLKMGILSQGSFLSTTASSGVAILHRGILMRAKLLCQSLPSTASLGLPNFTPPALGTPAAGQTVRNQLEKTVVQGSVCFACHQYFMPMGFALDHFDKFGRFRLTENGGAVNDAGFIAVSKYIDPETGVIGDALHSTSVTFNGYADFAKLLANDPALSACFAKQSTAFVTGRNDVVNNECSVDDAQTLFTSSGSKVMSGLSSYIQSPNFIQRTR